MTNPPGDEGTSVLSSADLPLAPGTLLHEYRIDAKLGQGGFGFTYRGFDLQLEQVVAVKEFFPADLARRQADGTVEPASPEQAAALAAGIDGFIDEARLVGKVEHRGVMEVRRFFRLNGTAYMVLRYEDGPTLRAVIAERPIEEARLRSILSGLLDALQALHDVATLHRDAKPSNIILSRNRSESREEVPVLIDFGAARDFSRSDPDTSLAVGAPGYAPPEQYAGSSGEQGPWTDLYALGATAYACITGHPPPPSLQRQRADSLVPATVAGAGRYHPDFLDLVDRMLRLDDTQRPQSAIEVSDALKAIPLLPAEDYAPLPATGSTAADGPVQEVVIEAGVVADDDATAPLPSSPPALSPGADPAKGGRARAALIGLLVVALLLIGGGYAYREPARQLICDQAGLLCQPVDIAYHEATACFEAKSGCAALGCALGFSEKFPASRYDERIAERTGSAVSACLVQAPSPHAPPAATETAAATAGQAAACGPAVPETAPAATIGVLSKAVLAGPAAWSPLIANAETPPDQLLWLGRMLLGMADKMANDQGFEALYAAAYRNYAPAQLWMAEAYDPTRTNGPAIPGVEADAAMALEYYKGLGAACPDQSRASIEGVCGWLKTKRGAGIPAQLQAFDMNCLGG